MNCLILFLLPLTLQYSQGSSYYNNDDPLEKLIFNHGGADRNFVQRLKWNTEMDKIPNADQRMMELFCSYYKEKNADMLGGVLAALDLRDALPQNQLNELVSQIDRLNPPLTKDHFTGVLFGGIMHILHDYPSPEHERLGQKFINDSDTMVQWAAIKLLAQIGGPESFKVVQNAVARRKKAQIGFADAVGLEMTGERDRMRDRLIRLKQIDQDDFISVNTEKEMLDAEPTKVEGRLDANVGYLGVGIMALVIVGVGYFLFRK